MTGSTLGRIQDFMQRTSEVIAMVLGVEVMIIDEFCQLVAATGRIIPELGSDYGQGP